MQLQTLLTQSTPRAESFPDLTESPNADVTDAIRRVMSNLDSAWSTAADVVVKAIEGARTELTKLRLTWQTRFDERRAAFDEAVAAVSGEHGEPNVREFLQLDAAIDKLKALEKSRDSEQKAVDGLLRTRREAVAALREVRRKTYQVRERTARLLTKQLEGNVRVDVTHQGNRAIVGAFLRSVRSGAGHRQLEQLVARDDFSPPHLAELCRRGPDALVTEYGASEGLAQQLVQALGDEQLDELEAMRLDDLVEIALNVGTTERPDFRTLDRLSAGQRSTAILLLALLESDGPLILDQPEDDLDNRFIYEDVVRRLRASKEQRQFIIATHNANIPVLGDAEQILVLDAGVSGDRLRAFVLADGSIDDADLHGPLEDVLEGGREAFERRKEKYGF